MILGTTTAARRVFLLALTIGFAVAVATPSPAASGPIDDADRAAVEHACPCAGPATGGAWRSHRDYAACASRAVRALAHDRQAGLRQLLPLLRETATSACGVRYPGPSNVHICLESSAQIACQTVRTAHADECGECSAAVADQLVTCALVADSHDNQWTTCRGPGSVGSTPGSHVVDLRTGLDCASCEAKLGTPASTGVTCVDALCGQL
jgi:hypothetical protein